MARKIDILRGVQLDGRMYRAGNEQDAVELEKKLNKKQFERLTEAGAIGPATTTSSVTSADFEEESEEDEEDEALGPNFPFRFQLIGAGLKTKAAIADADDETLLGISGIGEASLEKIRAALT